MYEIDFGIYSTLDGTIVGYFLIAGCEAEAEEFCSTLPKAFKEGRGGMDVVPDGEGGCKIVFTNELSLVPGTFEVVVSKEQGEAIKELWRNPEKLGLFLEDNMFTSGFKVILISEKDSALVRTEIKD